jgi:hypothetical protein
LFQCTGAGTVEVTVTVTNPANPESACRAQEHGMVTCDPRPD